MSQHIPIQSLVFFEATARHKSFTKAADELCVTQSAVSKQIKNLEYYLECILFERKYHDLQLTPDGMNLFEEIQPLVHEIKNCMLSLKNKKHSKIVNIVCTHAVAHYFLFPKIVLFNQMYPDITINIISTNKFSEKECIENDFGILYSDGKNLKLHADLLFEEEIYPVTRYEDELPDIQHPEELLNLKLLQLDAKKWKWMNWKIWFQHFGIAYHIPVNLPVYNQVTLAVNASALGMGVTLGWDFMVKMMVQQRVLKKVGNLSFKTGYADYLVYSKYKKLSPSAEKFRQWLLQDHV